jgi:hypothetical protein
LGKIFFYVGRALQLIGMWLLLVDLFTAGPMGPDPKMFGAGVVVFLVGWGMTSLKRYRTAATVPSFTLRHN